MKPIKAFISHRGTQKDRYVNKMIEYIGDDNKIIVDSKNFKNGERTYSEIEKWMNRTALFVAVISKDYPAESDATQYELDLAEDMAKGGRIKILPIICEEGLDYNNISPELSWMTEKPLRLTIRPFTPPKLAAERIKGALHELYYDDMCGRKFRWHYIGRTKERDSITRRIINTTNGLRCIMVSGRKGTGRNSFARLCKEEVTSHDVLPITLQEGAGLLELAVALHSALGQSNEELAKLHNLTHDELRRTVVSDIEQLVRHEFLPLIKDNKSIVAGATIQPWFLDLLNDDGFGKGLRLLVISSSKPRPKETSTVDSMAHVHLEALQFEERAALLKQFCTLYCGEQQSMAIPTERLHQIVNKLTNCPRQLSKFAEIISSEGLNGAMDALEKIRALPDGTMGAMLKDYRADPVAKTLLRMLAEITPASIDALRETFSDDDLQGRLDPIIDSLTTDGLIDYHGTGYGYISLDPGMADHLRRSKIPLPENAIARYDKICNDGVRRIGGVKYHYDLAVWYRKMELDLRSNLTSAPGLKMPSLVLANVMRLYDSEKYEEVIALGNKALENPTHFPETTSYTIRYKICQSHIRLGNKKEIQPLDKAHHDDEAMSIMPMLDYPDREFLKGFRLRLSEDKNLQGEAIRHFEEALKCRPSMHVASRELVESYLIIKDYPNALKYARSNFERAQDNAYHIYAYFKALLHSPTEPNREATMADLIARMARSDYKRSDRFLCEMQSKQMGQPT